MVFASPSYNLFCHTRILHVFATCTVAVTALLSRLFLCRRSRQGRRRPFTFSLSLLRQRQRLHETRTSPLSQPLQPSSHSQSPLSHTTPTFSSSSSATLPKPAPTSQLRKRAGPANSQVDNNKKIEKAPPPPPPIRALHGLTLNIRGMTLAKLLSIQGLPVFSSLDYINLD